MAGTGFALPGFAQQDLGEPTTSACPVTSSAAGTVIRRAFTSSKGRTLSFSLKLPADFDPAKPRGIVLYLHGNDNDNGGTFYPQLERVPENTEEYGLVPAVALSPETRVDPDATVRDWKFEDDLVLEELLDSDFGGCLKLDRDQVYFAGESQGTCVLSSMLTSFLWRKYRGGILGYCGCWGFHEYSWRVDPEQLRSRFKVFVENTTEDFLYNRGLMGFDHYRYNYGLDVRTDLLRPGQHCVDARIHGAEALSWMLGKGQYPEEETFQPSWQQLDSNLNYDSAIAINAKGQVVSALARPSLTLEQKEQVGQKRRELTADEFNTWAVEAFPEFERPPVQLDLSDDYGDTWQHLATLDTLLFDALASRDGHFYIATRDGLLRDDGTGKNFAPYALIDQRIDAVEEDEQGTLYAYGAVLMHVKRSKDHGATWEDLLNAPSPVGGLARERDMLLYSDGVLTMVQADAALLYSKDHGDSWESATLPTKPEAFTHFGETFYVLSGGGTKLQMSPDAGKAWQDVPLPTKDFLQWDMSVTPTGDLLVQGSELAYRSTDKGATFQRERGLHNLLDMSISVNASGQAVASGLRGVFRYQMTPPVSMPGAGGSGGGAIGGQSSSAGVGGMSPSGAGNASGGTMSTSTPSNGMSDAEGESGCGCSVPGRAPGSLLLGWLALIPFLRRRR